MFRALRQFSSGRVTRNIVSDLYLKELKAVKVAPFSLKDAEGNVKPWAPPARPTPPQSELGDLKNYKDEAVETLHAPATESGATAQVEEDWLVLAEEEPAH